MRFAESFAANALDLGLIVWPNAGQLADGTGTPIAPERFVRDLADTLIEVVSDPENARRMGEAGRQRAEAEFGWDAVAERTRAIYASLL